jgi:hypothetical protein
MIYDRRERIAKWLLRLARGLSLLLTGSWLFVGIASLFDELGPVTWESLFVGLAIVTAVIFTAAAWRQARLGGLLLIIFGLLFSIFGYFSAGNNQWFAVLVSGVPFMITGLLFLASWWLTNAPDPDWIPHFE